MLVRARVVSFLSGFAVAGSVALYQLRQDIWESHRLLASQVGPRPPGMLSPPRSCVRRGWFSARAGPCWRSWAEISRLVVATTCCPHSPLPPGGAGGPVLTTGSVSSRGQAARTLNPGSLLLRRSSLA